MAPARKRSGRSITRRGKRASVGKQGRARRTTRGSTLRGRSRGTRATRGRSTRSGSRTARRGGRSTRTTTRRSTGARGIKRGGNTARRNPRGRKVQPELVNISDNESRFDQGERRRDTEDERIETF